MNHARKKSISFFKSKKKKEKRDATRHFII